MTYSEVDQTCAQVAEIPIRDLNREAREMKRLAGARAHVFLWVSGSMLAEDPQLKVLDEAQPEKFDKKGQTYFIKFWLLQVEDRSVF